MLQQISANIKFTQIKSVLQYFSLSNFFSEIYIDQLICHFQTTPIVLVGQVVPVRRVQRSRSLPPSTTPPCYSISNKRFWPVQSPSARPNWPITQTHNRNPELSCRKNARTRLYSYSEGHVWSELFRCMFSEYVYCCVADSSADYDELVLWRMKCCLHKTSRCVGSRSAVWLSTLSHLREVWVLIRCCTCTCKWTYKVMKGSVLVGQYCLLFAQISLNLVTLNFHPLK